MMPPKYLQDLLETMFVGDVPVLFFTTTIVREDEKPTKAPKDNILQCSAG
jgi:hypothetical protein